MQTYTRLHTRQKKLKQARAGRQAWISILPFLLILLILSSCMFLPNTAYAASHISATPQVTTTTLSFTAPYHYSQQRVSQQTTAPNDSCQDVVFSEWVGWSIRIYLNECALEHLSALSAGADAVAGVVNFISLWCQECVPVAVGLSAVAAVLTANIDFLQYTAQVCGGTGVYLEISFYGGWQFLCANDVGA